MLKLIRMHTATDSVYWAHINAMIDRTGEMLVMSDSVIRDFVRFCARMVYLRLTNQSQTPSGGEAQDSCQASSSSPKRKLEDTEPTVPTKSEKKVKVASPPTSPKRKLSDTEPKSHQSSKKAAKAARKQSSANNIDPATTPTANGTPKAGISTNYVKAKGKSNNEHFFVDTNPTPFNTPAVPTNKSSKRREPPSTDETPTVKKSKKAKVEHCPTIPTGAQNVEFEDITAEVDARLQAKEEKRRKAAEEEEKKRAKEAEKLKEFMTAKARETPNPTQPTPPAENLADLSVRKRKRKQSTGGTSGESHTEKPFIVPKKPKNKGNLGPLAKKRTNSSAYEAGDEGDGGKISTVLGGESAGTAARPKKKVKSKKGKEKEVENNAPEGGE